MMRIFNVIFDDVSYSKFDLTKYWLWVSNRMKHSRSRTRFSSRTRFLSHIRRLISANRIKVSESEIRITSINNTNMRIESVETFCENYIIICCSSYFDHFYSFSFNFVFRVRLCSSSTAFAIKYFVFFFCCFDYICFLVF